MNKNEVHYNILKNKLMIVTLSSILYDYYPEEKIKKSAKICSGYVSAFAHPLPVSIKANSQIHYPLLSYYSVCFYPYQAHRPSLRSDEKNRPQPHYAGPGDALGGGSAV